MAIIIGHKNQPGAQYIGRGSPLGNPYVMVSGSKSERDLVCDMYEAWFRDRVEQKDPRVMNELRRLYVLAKQGDLVLGCFCAPKRCHGETIKRFLESYLTRDNEL